MNEQSTIARPIAAEDIEPGQYIVILQNRVVCDPYDEDGEQWRQPRKWRLPWDVEPYLVKAICVPYILVIDAEGDVETLDIRRHRFARVPESFGRVPFDLKKEKEQRENDEGKKDQGKAASESDSV